MDHRGYRLDYLLSITSGEDAEMMYPRMIAEFMPVGLRGLMVASLLAAFMSTIDTQLNWGASYLVNDVYKRFIVPEAPAKHYVLVSRISVVALMITAAVATHYYDSIRGAWFYLAVLMSGSGLVLLLRWYWWRVNAWSEITALVSTFILANGKIWLKPFLRFFSEETANRILWFYSGEAYAVRLATITLVVTVIWIAVTFLTRPVAPARLAEFYRRVRPSGWWGPVAEACPEVQPESARQGWLGWLFGMICVYTGLFGLGYLCLGQYLRGGLLVGTSLIMVFFTVAQVPADTQEEDAATSES